MDDGPYNSNLISRIKKFSTITIANPYFTYRFVMEGVKVHKK
ncbi:hypothetical protein [Candidatus Clostridium radicumherbarum]|uniref:Uncharacterized protein n=1 Tax=Candidatus Clostridium radicumherbarum TaxID=3381662 RepID=A0ABW8TUH5_9CLOT